MFTCLRHQTDKGNVRLRWLSAKPATVRSQMDIFYHTKIAASSDDLSAVVLNVKLFRIDDGQLPAPNISVAPIPIAEPRPFVEIINMKAMRLILPFAFGSRAAAPACENNNVIISN